MPSEKEVDEKFEKCSQVCFRCSLLPFFTLVQELGINEKNMSYEQKWKIVCEMEGREKNMTPEDFVKQMGKERSIATKLQDKKLAWLVVVMF